jgi:hypothetical protein
MATTAPSVAQHHPGRGLLLAGLALTVLALAAYVAQVLAGRLTTPWYLPALTTIAALMVLLSLQQRRSIWRGLALVLVVLLAAAQWAFLTMVRLPEYTGPVAVGRPFPAFASVRADGTPFREGDLVGPQSSVLVFFRGRW